MTVYDARYIELAELKREIPFSAADFDMTEAEFDALLQGDASTDGLMERASQRIESWADTQWFTSQITETTERPEYAPGRELPLNERPVQSVASVTVDGDALDASRYVVEDTFLRLTGDKRPRKWPDNYRSVEVTYTHGFETVPEAVTGAVIRLVRNALDQVQSDGLTNESVGDMSFTYRPPSDIKREVQAELPDTPSYHGGVNTI